MADEKQAQPANNVPGDGQQPAPSVPPQVEAKFTQADIDRIINDRLARVKSRFADYDELKRFHDTAEQSQKSELEKAADRAAKAEAKAKDAEARALNLQVESAATSLAVEMGFLKPKGALKLADLSTATKDGSIDPDAIKKALEQVKTDYPELTKAPLPKVAATNPEKSGGPQESIEAKRARLLRGQGGIDDWFGGSQFISYEGFGKGEQTPPK